MSCLFPFASTSKSRTLDAFSDEKRPPSSSSQPTRMDMGDFPRANYLEDDRSGAKQERAHALEQLKMEMMDRKLDVYIVPSEDEHLSEYIADADKRRAYITGFSGSAGVAVITGDDNLLYVDSRYWVQAALQVSSSWTVKRVGDKDQKDWATDLVKSSEQDVLRIGIDPSVISAGAGGTHSMSTLLDAPNLTVVPVSDNLVDMVWKARPSRPATLIDLHPIEFTGFHSSQKLKDLVNSPALAPSSSSISEGYFVSALDELCWLLNLRCLGDIPCTPVFHAYLWIPLPSSTSSVRTLFVNSAKLSNKAHAYLAGLDIDVHPYEAVWPFLKQISKSTWTVSDEKTEKKRVVLTGRGFTWKTQLAVGKDKLVSVVSPILEAKAVKNEVELQGMRAAYRRDGLATVRWIAQLDHLITKQGRKIDEYEAGEMLTKIRRQGQHYRGLAYDNISGSGPNGALPHYSPVQGKCRLVDRETPYVNDSGAQYLDGTIDTTRTWHLGTPTDEQKDAFTRVLQGHIAVDTVVFSAGTTGVPMNILARKALWAAGLDFGHGVGHGIGSYLSVHEGPQGIPLPYPFKVGHVISNEPGYYKEGHWGMRHESVLEVVPASFQHAPSSPTAEPPKFLAFRRLTRVPIQTSLLEPSLLSPDEKAWVKAHNEQCKRELLPLLKGKSDEDKLARKWLERC